MMAGSRTFTVLPFVFLMLLMRCDGNALDLPVHLRTERATVTSFMCNNAPAGAKCVSVNVTECPVTAHVCYNATENDAKLHITRDDCLIASRGGINLSGLFIEVFVDKLSWTKQAVCTYYDTINTTPAPAEVSYINATKMTICAGDASCTSPDNVTYCRGNGSIRDIAIRDKQRNALTPEISDSNSSFEMFNLSSLVYYKSSFTMERKGAMIEVYILEPLGSDYQLHIDTDTDVCVKNITFAWWNSALITIVTTPPPPEGHFVALTASVSVLAVICAVVLLILVLVFKKRWTSRSRDFTSNSREAEVPLQEVTI